MNATTLSLDTLAVLAGLFLALYGFARWIDNFSVVDVAWSYAFGGLAISQALLGGGWLVRRALVGSMVLLWSLRLGTHLLVRIARRHPEEDGRYLQLRRDWERGLPLKMGAFFLAQAVSVVVLSLPFICACANPREELSPAEASACLLWLFSIAGEALADHQLASFTGDPANRGRVCDTGLWRYSRHPNYFFEWLVWVSYCVFALGSPWGWVGILSPVCILYLLLRVTGIPATEEQSTRSKGDAYRSYQATTSAFFPRPPRRN